MKIIGSVKEDLTIEKRISITPETLKKFIDLKFSVFLEKNYAVHLDITDEEYKNKGANFYNSAKEVLEKSEIILRVNSLSNEEIHLIKDKSILIGQFDPLSNKETINKLIKKDVKIFSLNLLPRITRAQSMDVLSSQANLAGYRAVIESVEEFGKAVPMMMTAAGTITPAKVLVIGAGVAGLQAMATATRLGAIVSATDVRTVAKEQVESLGAKFLAIVVTFLFVDILSSSFILTICALVIGGSIGTIIALRISMTARPQLVAGFHSLVGLAAVLVALSAFYSPETFGLGTINNIKKISLVEMSIGASIGAITFTGSVIAFLKLQGLMIDSSLYT